MYDWNLLDSQDLLPEVRKALELSDLPNLEGYLFDRHRKISVGPIKSNKTAPYVVPPLPDRELTFSHCLDEVVTEILHTHKNSKIYLAWSGGVDSTTLVCAMLRNATKDMLDRVTILCSNDSVLENQYFFYRIIKPMLQVADINEFKIDSQFVSNGSIMMDGECGNQINLGYWTYDLISSDQWDLLEAPFKDAPLHKIMGVDANSPGLKNLQEILFDSAESAPVDIKTVYDLAWWSNFNFKLDYVMYRKAMPTYTKHLTQSETKIFFEKNLVHAYAHTLMQQWAMSSLLQRRTFDRSKTAKYFQKDYIYQIDKNPYYFRFKPEQSSMATYYTCYGKGIPTMSDLFAVTDSFKKLSFFNAEDRQTLKKWLFG
jgi:hypothetical protein